MLVGCRVWGEQGGCSGMLGWRVLAGCWGGWTVNRGRVALDFVPVIATAGLGPGIPDTAARHPAGQHRLPCDCPRHPLGPV